jgi:hypothetical protein
MSNPQIQNDTIYALPHLYLSGLSISPASTTLLSVAPGAARDANNVIDMVVGLQNYFGNVNPAIQNANYQAGLLIQTGNNNAIFGSNT